MADILRGEIWWANLNPTRGREQSGTRPVLIISQDVFNRHSGTVIALRDLQVKNHSSFNSGL
jgi:mRNA interferase MazF